jgi:hypothetical protein
LERRAGDLEFERISLIFDERVPSPGTQRPQPFLSQTNTTHRWDRRSVVSDSDPSRPKMPKPVE